MARKPLKFELNPLLSGPTLEARNRSGSPYRELNLADIDVDPDQPRRSFSTETIAELAASIKQHGLINPILVRLTEGGTYRVVAGERRFRACRLLGKETIPAIIESEDRPTAEVLAKQLVENLQREDLSPLERSEAIGKLREATQLSIRDLAAQLGASKSFVQRSLDILSLPDDLKRALAEGGSESKLLLLAQVKDLKSRAILLSRLEDLTRRELEGEIARLSGFRAPEKVSHGGTVERHQATQEDRRIAAELQETLRMKVQIARRSDRKDQGRVTIDFYSDDDLAEIYNRLMR